MLAFVASGISGNMMQRKWELRPPMPVSELPRIWHDLRNLSSAMMRWLECDEQRRRAAFQLMDPSKHQDVFAHGRASVRACLPYASISASVIADVLTSACRTILA